MGAYDLSIVLPTYNERENLEILIPRLAEAFSKIPHEILIVDDSSTDGTKEAIRALTARHPQVRLLVREKKTGIGSALRYGYQEARGTVILSCDADLSFETADLTRLYETVGKNYDLVVGSRHVAGSFYERPSLPIRLKHLVSWSGNALLRRLFAIAVHDFSANCRAIRRHAWERLKTTEDTNFFLFEIILLARDQGFSIGEIPVRFLDRKHGTSKINHLIEIPRAFWKTLLFFWRRRASAQSAGSQTKAGHANSRPVIGFKKASLIWLLCQMWIFQKPLLNHQVSAFTLSTSPPPQCLVNMFDTVGQVLPSLFAQARLVREGTFPQWTPMSQGGTPLIAKMQNGVFDPLHVMLYLLPSSWMPYSFMLVMALRSYLAFIFAFLFARLLKLSFWAGVAAAILFVFPTIARAELLPGSGHSGLYQPLLLALAELYCLGYRRWTLFLLPWAAALPFLTGHFESALYVNLFALLYLGVRLWSSPALKTGSKLNRLLEFIPAMAVGGLLSAIQIIPAVEYVQNSYNKIWHDNRWFDIWDWEAINKRLSMADGPMLLVAASSLAVLAVLWRRSAPSPQPRPVGWGKFLACGLLLGTAIAALTHLGLDDSLISFYYGAPTPLDVFLFMTLLLLSFWECTQAQEPGLKALGVLAIIGLLLMIKTPPLTNMLIHIPPFGNLHNWGGGKWALQISLAVLSLSALQRCRALAQRSLAEKWKTAIQASLLPALFLLGYIAAAGIKAPLAWWIPAGPAHSQPQDSGWIMGPRQQFIRPRDIAITGRIPAAAPVAAIRIGLVEGEKVLASTDATTSSIVNSRARYFRATLKLPDKPGVVQSFAQIQDPAGGMKYLQGTRYTIGFPGSSSWGIWVCLGTICCLPILFLLGTVALRILPALLLLIAIQYHSPALPADQIPYKLGGIENIKKDNSLFRIFSLQWDRFLRADYASTYELSDLRTGGDFIDLLPMLYFNHLVANLSNSQNPRAFESGLRLLGLANVKYLVDFPEATLSHPGLATHYRGKDMAVFGNKFVLPRAMFYERAFVLPMGNWRDWGARGRFLRPILQLLDQGKMNIGETLLLNEEPAPHQPGTSYLRNSSVEIEEYHADEVRLRVRASRSGFVFLSDNHYPGWVAYLNGRKTAILRSWLTFRAVQVPPGESTLVFLYRSWPLWGAAFLTICISLAWLTLYWKFRLRRQTLRDPDPHPASKNKTVPPDPLASDELARMIELTILSLIGSLMTFWVCWSVFAFQGGIQSFWKKNSPHPAPWSRSP